MRKQMISIITTFALCLSLLPVPAALAAGGKTLTVGTTGDYKTLEEALLKAENGDTIQLLDGAKSDARPEGDVPLIIDKELTIDGGQNPSAISLWYAGIVLGADVTFKNMTVVLANPVRNAIIANGYTLTLESVQRYSAASGNPNEIMLFCGGLVNDTVGSLPETGEHGRIIVKGTGTLLGSIFAGNWSKTRDENNFEKPATITIDTSVGGTVGSIYACGAYEPLGTGDGNAIEPNSDIHKATGGVAINLGNGLVGKVYGATGDHNNASVVYKNTTTTLTKGVYLNNICALKVESGCFKPALNPDDRATASDISGADVTVAGGALLDLRDCGDTVSIGSWTGGDTPALLEMGEKQALSISGTVRRTAKVGIGGVRGTNNPVTAWGTANSGQIYIQVPNTNLTGNEFVFLPQSEGEPVPIYSLLQQGWTISEDAQQEIVLVTKVNLDPVYTIEADNYGFQVENAVTYSQDSTADLSAVELQVQVNGKSFERDCYGGYEALEGDTGGLKTIYFFENEEGDRGVNLWLEGDGTKGAIPEGIYQISITIPRSCLDESIPNNVIEFTLIVGTAAPVAPTAEPGTANGVYRFVDGVQVKLDCAAPGAQIYYTTDNSDPTKSTTAKSYAGPVSVTEDTVIKAAACLNGIYSDVTTFEYQKVTGYSVSGKVVSHNGRNNFTVTLYEGGTTTKKAWVTVVGNDGIGQVTQDFIISNVAPGTYDLVVTKEGHLSYTVTGVVVDSENLDLTKNANASISTITLLCGDMNGDETINSLDLNMVWKSTNYLKSTSDVGVEAITDVNGDGTVNSLDLNIIWKSDHYLKSKVSYTYTG